MPRTTTLLTFALIVALSLPACKSSQSPIFFTSPSSPFPDVPVPASFTLQSSSTPAGRYTDLTYQSTDALQPVTQYFIDQMPRHGWVLKNQSQGPNSAFLQYTKNADLLQIEISSGNTIRTNTRLRISPATTPTR